MPKGKKEEAKPLAEKPELFIASSAESIEVTHQLQAALQHYFLAKPWTAGVVKPSQAPIQSLEKELDKARYAVFVFGKDDAVISRGKKYEAVRDNVLLELGMFIGRLGSRRCFVLAPKSKGKLKIPSDLEGFMPVTYDADLFAKDPQTAMIPVATDIRNAIKELNHQAPATTPPVAEAGSPTTQAQAASGALVEAVADLLGLFASGAAGVTIQSSDKAALKVWSQTALKNALHVLKTDAPPVPKDAYVAWLRPKGSKGKQKLEVFIAENLPGDYNHYEFAPNEGLAGTVWASGEAGTHTNKNPHPKWKIRPGCDNESYLCVPVGSAGGPGGILSIGSDTGFKITPAHESILKVFAGVLAAVVGK